jgi:hypothetical protein
VREGRIELDEGVTLPEGARVRVTVLERKPREAPKRESLGEWIESARELQSRMRMMSDSVEILREICEERSNR